MQKQNQSKAFVTSEENPFSLPSSGNKMRHLRCKNKKWGISTSLWKHWEPRRKVAVVMWYDCTLPFFSGFGGKVINYILINICITNICIHVYTHTSISIKQIFEATLGPNQVSKLQGCRCRTLKIEEQTSELQLDSLNLTYIQLWHILSFEMIWKWKDDCVLDTWKLFQRNWWVPKPIVFSIRTAFTTCRHV